MSEEAKIYQKNAIRIARQLLYKDSVIKRLKKATTITEISRVMTSARKGEI